MGDEIKLPPRYRRLPRKYIEDLEDEMRRSRRPNSRNKTSYEGGSVDNFLADLFKGMGTNVRLPTGGVGTATPEVKRTRTGLGATLGVNVKYAKGGVVQCRGNGKSSRMKPTKIR